jgi:nitrite reductase (NO-forming)
MRLPLHALVLAALAVIAALVGYVLARETGGRPSSPRPAANVLAASHIHRHPDQSAAPASFAHEAPVNSDALAKAHAPYPAELPPISAGPVANVRLDVVDVTTDIAPGIRYEAWSFDGRIPGPILHVRQGQTVAVTLANRGAIPHSIDFHAARIAPDVAFRDVGPGESKTYRFVAEDPGVFMYHCFTSPTLMHVANGMFGVLVVDPVTPLPPVDHEYVLAASEWYLDRPGRGTPAQFSLEKAESMRPDWITFNGYADQYMTHPLRADPGDTVRFYVVAAGPTFDVDFHVVGAVLRRVWLNSDLSDFESGIQTVAVPAGGGAVMDVTLDEPGFYPFLSHAFGLSSLGEVGALEVGTPRGGRMKH